MTIMIDALFVTARRVDGQAGRIFGSGKMSCHLTVDGPLEELHAFAVKIGMQRAWFQDHPLMPHYDLTPGRRAAALRLGAVEVSGREQARRRRAVRRATLAAASISRGLGCPEGCACLCHTEVVDPGPTHLFTCAWSDPNYTDE